MAPCCGDRVHAHVYPGHFARACRAHEVCAVSDTAAEIHDCTACGPIAGEEVSREMFCADLRVRQIRSDHPLVEAADLVTQLVAQDVLLRACACAPD